MRTSRVLRFYRVVFLVLATYGMLYFSYKYDIPDVDYFDYYNMYQKPLDIEQAQAPFVYRQLGAVVTNVIYKSGLYYPNAISFADPRFSQRIFFSALLSNYIALLLTAVVVGAIVDRKAGKVLLLPPIIGGLLCFSSFFTQVSIITGLNDGWGWFLAAVGFYGYTIRRLSLVVPVLLVSIFQREVLPTVFFVWSCVDLLFVSRQKKRDRFYVFAAAASVLSLLGYVLMRKVLIPVAGYAEQLDLRSILSSILNIHPSKELIMQGVVSQNIYFIFVSVVLLLVALRKQRLISTDNFLMNTGLVQATCALLVILLIGLAAGIENDIGRYGAIITPIVASLTAVHLTDIENVVRPPAVSTA
jgi:hypothetical protein